MRALLYIAAAGAALSVLCIALLDQPFARFIATHETWPIVWHRGIAWLEYPLGIEPWPWTGICVLVAGSLLAAWRASRPPDRRVATVRNEGRASDRKMMGLASGPPIARWRAHARTWLLVTLVHVLARNVTMWLKWGTGRLRPSEWLARGGDTFWRDGGYSFPSGHVTLFASILVPLALCVPRARPLLAIVAFAMIARVAVNAHFLSDVIAALAECALLTWLCARLLPSRR